MKFEKKQFTGMNGEINYIYTLASESAVSPVQIVASRAGVAMQGTILFEDMGQLDEFAKTLAEAWKLHRKSQPNLRTNLAGH